MPNSSCDELTPHIARLREHLEQPLTAPHPHDQAALRAFAGTALDCLRDIEELTSGREGASHV